MRDLILGWFLRVSHDPTLHRHSRKGIFLSMTANNYIRFGFHPNITVLPFDDRDPSSVASAQRQVLDLSGGKPVGAAMWKSCTGLSYPLVGEVSRSAAYRSLV